MSELGKVIPQISIILKTALSSMVYFGLKRSGKWLFKCDFLADLLFFQHIQVNMLDFNAWKYWQTCHYIEVSGYKLYMGHIHTLVSTREWIAMLAYWHFNGNNQITYIAVNVIVL